MDIKHVFEDSRIVMLEKDIARINEYCRYSDEEKLVMKHLSKRFSLNFSSCLQSLRRKPQQESMVGHCSSRFTMPSARRQSKLKRQCSYSCSSLQLIPFFNMNVCYVIRCTYQSYRMYIHLPFNRWLGSLSCTYPSFRMYIHLIFVMKSLCHVALTHLSECISIVMFVPF